MKPAWTRPVCVLLFCLACSVPGLAAPPQNNPVPGGVLVMEIEEKSEDKPIVRFGDKPVYLTRGETHWTAIVGLPPRIFCPGNTS